MLVKLKQFTKKCFKSAQLKMEVCPVKGVMTDTGYINYPKDFTFYLMLFLFCF